MIRKTCIAATRTILYAVDHRARTSQWPTLIHIHETMEVRYGFAKPVLSDAVAELVQLGLFTIARGADDHPEHQVANVPDGITALVAGFLADQHRERGEREQKRRDFLRRSGTPDQAASQSEPQPSATAASLENIGIGDMATSIVLDVVNHHVCTSQWPAIRQFLGDEVTHGDRWTLNLLANSIEELLRHDIMSVDSPETGTRKADPRIVAPPGVRALVAGFLVERKNSASEWDKTMDDVAPGTSGATQWGASSVSRRNPIKPDRKS